MRQKPQRCDAIATVRVRSVPNRASIHPSAQVPARIAPSVNTISAQIRNHLMICLDSITRTGEIGVSRRQPE